MTKEFIIDKYNSVRQLTEQLCSPLETEDYVIQSAAFVSPAKWHLGHTSWFFEAFLLTQLSEIYQPINDRYNLIFNSYYKTQGQHWVQSERGQLSRPTVNEIYHYRHEINHLVLNLIETVAETKSQQCFKIINLGLNHEQQHQELLLMDILYNFSKNPLNICYYQGPLSISHSQPTAEFISFEGGDIDIGIGPDDDFFFDNECPKHRCFIQPFALRSLLITNREYLDFILDGGYQQHQLWHSDGLQYITNNAINSPLYWNLLGEEWHQYTLYGNNPLDLDAPVSHISFYEASAYAEWCGLRLATEIEWEYAASLENIGSGLLMQQDNSKINDLFGSLWQWTSSAYTPYPGYKRPQGAVGEYNGKFMCNQMVLRGGCFATPKDHFRKTYRNFYYPDQQWMFSGIRLAKDCK